ncbi:MAG: ASCH domain-containing protein [Vicinamibacterales bacterium]
MRNISFMLTQPQIRDRSKTVTRRLGWATLQPGTLLRGVEKAQGLKKGESIRPLCIVRVEDVRRERLDAITPEDCAREGFPELTPAEFVAMFCAHMKPCQPHWLVTRIAFSYVEQAVG